MVLAVVGQGDEGFGLGLAVEPDGRGAGLEALGVLDGDPVGRRPEAVGDLKAGPVGRDAGVDRQAVAVAMEPEDRLEDRAVEP